MSREITIFHDGDYEDGSLLECLIVSQKLYYVSDVFTAVIIYTIAVNTKELSVSFVLTYQKIAIFNEHVLKIAANVLETRIYVHIKKR